MERGGAERCFGRVGAQERELDAAADVRECVESAERVAFEEREQEGRPPVLRPVVGGEGRAERARDDVAFAFAVAERGLPLQLEQIRLQVLDAEAGGEHRQPGVAARAVEAEVDGDVPPVGRFLPFGRNLLRGQRRTGGQQRGDGDGDRVRTTSWTKHRAQGIRGCGTPQPWTVSVA